ncbi:MAG: hypothetical protein ACYDBH_14895 [Acidobacteriaceae bacterium]
MSDGGKWAEEDILLRSQRWHSSFTLKFDNSNIPVSDIVTNRL